MPENHSHKHKVAEHVVIIGIDGLGGFYIDQKQSEGGDFMRSQCPTLSALLSGDHPFLQTAVATTNARTVFPPISSPAWGSILSGLTPDQTGMMNNSWKGVGTDGEGGLAPTVDEEGSGGAACEGAPTSNIDEDISALPPLPTVPSPHHSGIPRLLFDLISSNHSASSHKLHDQSHPSGATDHFAAVSWSWLGKRLLSYIPNVETVKCDGDDDLVVEAFVKRFSRSDRKKQCEQDDDDAVGEVSTGTTTAGGGCTDAKPKVSFLHLDDVDHAGHGHGWGSDEYYASWKEADRRLQNALEPLRNTSTIVVVISDHGGSERGHGDMKRSHMQIPLVIATTNLCPAIVPTVYGDASRATVDSHCPSRSHIISAIDVVPTLLSLQGVPIDASLRGVVLASYSSTSE